MEKILTADFSNGASQIRLRGIWQHDYGAKLKVKGIDYSTLVRIDFAGANDPKAYPVVAVQETDGTFTAKIPKEVTDQAYDINAYIYVSGNDAGYTVKEVVMPVRERVEADPASGGGTATDPYAAVIEKMTEFAEGAKTSAGNAALSADTAGKSASAAQQAARSAAESASTATAAAQTATTAAGKASESATTATQAAETAGQKATAAETAAGKAAESATAAEKSATAAKESATAAKASETAATASAVTVTEQAEKIKASAEQIEKNRAGVAALKESVANKITKFYANNLGEMHITDSDSGKVQDMVVYGKSEQKKYQGYQLLEHNTAEYKFTATTSYYELVYNAPENIKSGAYYLRKLGNTPTVLITFLNASKKMVKQEYLTDKTEKRIVFETDVAYVKYIIQNLTVGTDYKGTVKLILASTSGADYEPYVGGIPSPSPDYPQEIKSVVNPTIKVCGKNLFDSSKTSNYAGGLTCKKIATVL